MDEALSAVAHEIVGSLPASVEMPAGTDKTQIVAALAAVGAETGRRTLVLTHTHAGVDAIRRRLQRFGVPRNMVHVDTIAGWAFDLVRSYPLLAGVNIPQDPNWSRSKDYVEGATRVVLSDAIQAVHAASFDYLVIDEYQDCVVSQHEFIRALCVSIPKACVLGDRLQGIFRFGDEDLIAWDDNLSQLFPPVTLTHTPWRWAAVNPALGQWLLDVRPGLLRHNPLVIDTSVVGVSWYQRQPNYANLATEASRLVSLGGSVLIIGKWPSDCASIAGRVYGFGVMEELQGKFMEQFLTKLDSARDRRSWASLLAKFAKDCFVGLAGLDAAILGKLNRFQAVGHLSRTGLAEVLVSLDRVVQSPSHRSVVEAMQAIEAVRGIRLIRLEAWHDTKRVLALDADTRDEPTPPHLARIRDHVRRVGRQASSRSVSRTLLVKGLEFDHVIVADADGLGDYENLYVAITRACRTLTVFSSSQTLRYT
ncbi:UvrD-helicase domain-containing protein [Nakamurella multipartita]|uniref:UvrD-like helicase ATP-binding domain-containing protein n=1 Tax=Nakamurella multipartita (strain ATCC 700099 / DSM 44233 / CIP 104796 / JCM 9543 / NBRC 105858 / Y-104) TaxID=479431 RepID=C8X6Z9_NAKMY|nr:UvrD-helicase domain-containing protein [Nakamurella multipartita]ACV80897.1 hypothetical protein Namu_4618 [Nakamurella multipartita DSM 44233]